MRILLLAAALAGAAPGVHAKDAFPSFQALSSAEPRSAYRIEVADRRSTVTVFAIHGGTIEPGTGEVAAAVAGLDWNLYRFEGMLSSAPWSQHVTSTSFDEPKALALAARSRLGISIHGQRDPGEVVCVGGGNAALRQAVAEALAGAGFETEQPCQRLPGKSPVNIVNRPAEGGVQLEISSDLLRELAGDPLRQRLGRFCAAVRAGVSAAGRKPGTARKP